MHSEVFSSFLVHRHGQRLVNRRQVLGLLMRSTWTYDIFYPLSTWLIKKIKVRFKSDFMIKSIFQTNIFSSQTQIFGKQSPKNKLSRSSRLFFLFFGQFTHFRFLLNRMQVKTSHKTEISKSKTFRKYSLSRDPWPENLQVNGGRLRWVTWKMEISK